ncbi:phosphatidylglycerophosphatase A [Otariodibacter sp.]|uniref:phosphatidylglycerophosphatase A family protein n=1 Tax=Otariodibacter sp. TaxID=3030919 RepID=UPI002607AE65|nr:phosphatidylglycerophosphatase A [Otariodibacter sp.]
MKINLKNPIHLLAVGFGSGLIKPAPGTWGSLLGTLIAILIWNLTASIAVFIALTVVSFLFGCYACQKTSEDTQIHDDGRIVWDEIVAIFFIFSFLPQYNFIYYTLAFGIFRIFDIWKPYPIRYIDVKISGGLGIMLDDIVAAVYTSLTLYCFFRIF